MIPVETAVMRVDTERAGTSTTASAAWPSGTASTGTRWPGSTAWPGGPGMGRAVLTRADHARLEELPADPTRRTRSRFDPLGARPGAGHPAAGLFNPVTVAAFNELWFRKAPRARSGQLQSISTYFHPLDGVGALEPHVRAAGLRPVPVRGALRRRGRPAQRARASERGAHAVVPGGAEAIRSRRPGPLSFPRRGGHSPSTSPSAPPPSARYSMRSTRPSPAPVRPRLPRQGRPPASRVLEAMYPRLSEWRATRDRVDPTAPSSRICPGASAWWRHRPARAGRRARAGPGPRPRPSRARPDERAQMSATR